MDWRVVTDLEYQLTFSTAERQLGRWFKESFPGQINGPFWGKSGHISVSWKNLKIRKKDVL